MSKLEKFLIVLIIIFAGVLLYNILKPAPKLKDVNFHLDYPTNIVTNVSSVSYADTLTHAGLKVLDIDSVRIVIHDLPDERSMSLMEDTKGFVISSTPRFLNIYMDGSMGRSQYIKILSHELIHVKQVYSGRLITDDAPVFIFDNKKYNKDFIPYSVHPWEQEAYRLQNQVSSELRQVAYQ